MEIVMDTSALLAVVTNEPTKSALIAKTKGKILVAPLSVHWEIGNAFSAMLKRKRATLEQVHGALANYHKIPLRYMEVELENAINIVDKWSIYAYDAYILVCAQQRNCPILTIDRGLIHVAKQMQIEVEEVKS